MKKQLLFLFSMLFVFTLNYGQSNSKGKAQSNNVTDVVVNKQLTKKQAKKARKKHAKNLANSPYKKTLMLSKKERL